jgi:hypothetical protein
VNGTELHLYLDAVLPNDHMLDGLVVPRMTWTSEGHRPRLKRQRLDPIVLELIESGSQGLFNIVLRSRLRAFR